MIENLNYNIDEKGKVFCALIDGNNCNSAESLFKEFATKFKFPEYFGENWPAFDECLNDLEWLDSESYALFIKDFNNLLIDSEEDFKVFVEVINSTIKEWITGRGYDSIPTPPTPFHLILHCTKSELFELEPRLIDTKFNTINKVTL